MQINSCYQDKDGAWADRHHADTLADAKRIALDIVSRPGFDCVEVVDAAGEVVYFHERAGLSTPSTRNACDACNGSGYYDAADSPSCGNCKGSASAKPTSELHGRACSRCEKGVAK